jgi:hypothetical protein
VPCCRRAFLSCSTSVACTALSCSCCSCHCCCCCCRCCASCCSHALFLQALLLQPLARFHASVSVHAQAILLVLLLLPLRPDTTPAVAAGQRQEQRPGVALRLGQVDHPAQHSTLALQAAAPQLSTVSTLAPLRRAAAHWSPYAAVPARPRGGPRF